MTKKLTALLIALVALIKVNAQNKDTTAHISDAKVAPWFVERFRLTAGGFLAVNNTSVQVGVKGGAGGTDIDFEKDLGYSQSVFTFLANFQWRISRRSRLNLNYYNIPRNSTHTLDKEIIFKDSVYPVNATVKSFFNTAIYQFSYGYAILAKPRYELGVLIGAHIVGAKAGISLQTAIGGSNRNTDFGFTAPLPDLGLWGGYAITDRIAVNFDADYLALTVNDIKGSILAYNVLFLYRVLPQLDVSLGYSGLNFKVTATKPDLEGQFKWGYNGPYLGATFNFGKRSWTHSKIQ